MRGREGIVSIVTLLAGGPLCPGSSTACWFTLITSLSITSAQRKKALAYSPSPRAGLTERSTGLKTSKAIVGCLWNAPKGKKPGTRAGHNEELADSTLHDRRRAEELYGR